MFCQIGPRHGWLPAGSAGWLLLRHLFFFIVDVHRTVATLRNNADKSWAYCLVAASARPPRAVCASFVPVVADSLGTCTNDAKG